MYTNNRTTRRCWSVLFVLALLSCQHLSLSSKETHVVSITNDSDSDIVLNWIHPLKKQPIAIENIAPHSSFFLRTFVGHEFELQRVNDEVCKIDDNLNASQQQECQSQSATFVVNDNVVWTENVRTELIVGENLELLTYNNTITTTTESRPVLADLKDMKSCEEVALDQLDEQQLDQAMEVYFDCAEKFIAAKLEKAAVVENELVTFRQKTAKVLENYTCTDIDRKESSPDVETRDWYHQEQEGSDPRRHIVHVKHNRPSSQIHVIENFITPEECQAMEDAAQTKLGAAAVADGQGGTHVSEHRRAKQAAVDIPYKKEPDHVISKLSQRVYNYTNSVTGLNLSQEGQEPLMSIQYEGRGLDDNTPDRYEPHCDGQCNGLHHRTGTRVASMVMYCTVPTTGGHTNFGQANVHVVPKQGNAVFFSYINPTTRVTDRELSQHSGCPVYEGTKKIVTQWMRLGVDEENTWDSFNSLGVKRSVALNQ